MWNPHPEPNEKINWSGRCEGTIAQGSGTLQWFKDERPNGSYEGEMRYGMYNGHGTDYRVDGRKYVGEWKDGLPNGQGVSYNADGAVLRSGNWANGVFGSR